MSSLNRSRLQLAPEIDPAREDVSTEDRGKWRYEEFGAPFQITMKFVDWLRAGAVPSEEGSALTTEESWSIWSTLTTGEKRQLVARLSHVSSRVRHPAEGIAYVFCPTLHPDYTEAIIIDRPQPADLDVISLLWRGGRWRVHQVGEMLDPRTVGVEPYSW